MDLPINAPIRCSDGVYGHSTAIILNPVSTLITHLVVREPGMLGVERMIPVELVVTSTLQQIELSCSKHELGQMPPYISNHYLPPAPALSASYGTGTMLWPFIVNQSATEYDQENVAADALTIHRGAHVHATDGHIGEVEEFLVNAPTSTITHVVLRHGHLWNQQQISIPIMQIDHMDDNTIFLTLNKQQVGALPINSTNTMTD